MLACRLGNKVGSLYQGGWGKLYCGILRLSSKYKYSEINVMLHDLQCNQLLKFRQTPLVTESLGLLESAVPQTKDEDEPDAGM